MHSTDHHTTHKRPRLVRATKTAIAAIALVMLTTASGLAIGTTGAEAATGYRVAWTGTGLNVRTGPTTSGPVIARLGDGTALDLACYQYGTPAGTRGNRVWYRLNAPVRGGWVTAAYVTTPSDPLPGLPACGSAAPAPSRPGIAGAEGAINWMNQRMGNRSYDGWCLKAVWEAYRYGAGRDIGRAPTAYAYWAARPAAQHRDRNAPRGALVFFDGYYAGEHAGHVGISLGDGRYVSSYDATGRGIHIGSLNGRTSYLGWIAP